MEQFAKTLDISTTIRHFTSADQHPQNHPQFKDELVAEENFAIIRHTGNMVAQLPFKADHYALVLCLAGSAVRTINQFRFEVTANTLHLTTPHSLNAWHQATEDLDLYIVLFKKEFLADGLMQEAVVNNLLDHDADKAPVCLLAEHNKVTIYSLLQKLDQEFHSQQPFHRQMLRLLFFELLFECNRAVGREQPAVSITHPNRTQQLVNHYKKLVEAHFMQLRTVQEYADLLFVTAKHLSEVVKHETGLTPLQLIHNRIYQEAKYWLCASELSVKEIADKLNFDTSSHFSRFFKHFAGCNPTEFQRIKCAIL
ncbi:helix-turn-helix domain-containing protein [Mucilaginibacter polytrichastri]|nr:helix-turn-helix domain-containing protein [Mucilaginibacter polytrichastri]SFT21891.1 AraC-type DNA-binding protein [Mucilaginibacter polytrichastri]